MNTLMKYFIYRQSLIDQYIKGDMDKREYLAKNLDAVLSLNIKPFQNIDSVEKGLFNYQYYNAMAKEAKMSGSYTAFEKADYFYSKKDKATLKILDLKQYYGVDAYFIKVRSKALKGKLFEILIDDYKMILHSTSTLILNRLREERVFHENIKTSLIDTYINQKY